jgi:alpha-galactosidase
MRLGLQPMRDAVGPDNYLLGCSAVFGPEIGYVDGSARDVQTRVDFNGEASPVRSRSAAISATSFLPRWIACRACGFELANTRLKLVK